MIAKVCEVVSILKIAVVGFLITCGVAVVIKGQGLYSVICTTVVNQRSTLMRSLQFQLSYVSLEQSNVGIFRKVKNHNMYVKFNQRTKKIPSFFSKIRFLRGSRLEVSLLQHVNFSGEISNFQLPISFDGSSTNPADYGLAFYYCLFTFQSWNSLNYMTGGRLLQQKFLLFF